MKITEPRIIVATLTAETTAGSLQPYRLIWAPLGANADVELHITGYAREILARMRDNITEDEIRSLEPLEAKE